ncbi:MAG: metallophosphoesterase [Polyangiaceae bacterium]
METLSPRLSRALLLFLELPATACAGFHDRGFGDAGAEIPPSNPSASDASTADQVGPRGGRVSRLYFAVVGDTRPATVDDTSGYPLTVIATIFQDLQLLDPAPLFAVSTGDYIFASARGGQAAPQLGLYLRARAAFSGILFPAMGNHECTGATASNCGPANSDGVTDNYAQFLATMLAPLGQTRPYYSFDVGASSGSWSAKFVVIAANAWDDVQASWLEASLARPTTYTFIVRHEPASAAAAPGVLPSEQIQARYPYTLAIVGHSHTYARSGPREVTIGNGGAPLTSTSANYGFGLVQQRADGSIQVDAVDYATMKRDPSFVFAVHPDGSPAP